MIQKGQYIAIEIDSGKNLKLTFHMVLQDVGFLTGISLIFVVSYLYMIWSEK